MCRRCGSSRIVAVDDWTNKKSCTDDFDRLPIPGRNNLATRYPHVAEEWDYERNGDLKPEHFAGKSNKKVWWKCKNCGMSWMARICSRTNGSGCPYDSGRYAIPGKTDLASRYPHIAEEWDHERNGDLKPEQFAAKSGKAVWWKCRNCGMSWKATIRHRANGKGCPYDAGKIPIPGKSDLASQYPHIAEEWDYEQNGDLKPEQFTAKSNKKVWWKCRNCGMSWMARICGRTNGSGCPYDSGRYVIPGKTDLASQYPHIAEEWDYERNGDLKPECFAAKSNKKVWWKCRNCGMSWKTTIASRTYGRGCPFDAGNVPIPGKTDLVSQHPYIAEEWDYERNGDLKPEQFTAKSNKKVWWKCRNCGMSWETRIHDRANGTGCPFDYGRLPILGKTDLASRYPHIAEEWDYEQNGDLKPEQFTAKSNKKVWWKCRNCGMSWEARIYNRANGKGCPFDYGRLPILGKTDLASQYPHIAEEWDYERNGDLKPEQFTAKSNKKVWWKCRNCGMCWNTPIYSRTNGYGCPYDAGKIPIPGKTDLASQYPDIIEEWDYELNGDLKPKQFTSKSHKKVWWKCRNCRVSWKSAISDRTSGRGCPNYRKHK